MNNSISYAETRATSSILWFLTLTYTVIIILSNWFDSRLVQVFNMSTDAGTLVFPLTFLLSNLITEVYGFKHARRAVWCGFLFNALFVVYSQIVIHLPSPAYATNNQAFDTILTLNSRIIFASTMSYLLSEPFNSYVMATLKIKMQGRYLGVRFMLSTVVAAGVDSFIFTMIAFYNSMENHTLFLFMLTMWLVKIVIEILGLPISIRLTKKLKIIEQLDIYDRKTNFNFFTLETHYSDADNDFWKNKGSV